LYYSSSNFIPNYNYELTATELYQEYRANEVTADEKYKVKRIVVIETVEETAKDIMDKPNLFLFNELIQINKQIFYALNCNFSR
jgi:hypothetical protein